MREDEDWFIVVKLDRYAGNVDEFVCAALTGRGGDRSDYEEGRAIHDRMFPEEGEEEPDLCYISEYFTNMNTEYGYMPYTLANDTNALLMKFDSYTTEEDARKVVRLWRERIPNMELVHVDTEKRHGYDRSIRVVIKGFEWVKVKKVKEVVQL